jgi:hypothetical protein
MAVRARRFIAAFVLMGATFGTLGVATGSAVDQPTRVLAGNSLCC